MSHLVSGGSWRSLPRVTSRLTGTGVRFHRSTAETPRRPCGTGGTTDYAVLGPSRVQQPVGGDGFIYMSGHLNDLRFAMLVCSELTNIGHRAALRGRVDALFVPEWNQGTETFNALVESAALDTRC